MTYRIYKPWGRLIKETETIDEVMKWIHEEYPNVPPHYYRSVIEADKISRNGSILCWGGVEVKKGEDQMTGYTSF